MAVCIAANARESVYEGCVGAEDLFLLLTGMTDIVVEVAVQTQSEPGTVIRSPGLVEV